MLSWFHPASFTPSSPIQVVLRSLFGAGGRGTLGLQFCGRLSIPRWFFKFTSTSRMKETYKKYGDDIGMILLMAEILHHLGWCWNPINNGINYQPQLVSRISAINSMGMIEWLQNLGPREGPRFRHDFDFSRLVRRKLWDHWIPFFFVPPESIHPRYFI